MGAAGSKITEVEKQPEPLPLPRCQTTLPGEASVPRQITLKRRWNDLEDTAIVGQDFKKRKVQETSKNAASAPIASSAPSAVRQATASNELAAHPSADRTVRSQLQQTEKGLDRHHGESSDFNETPAVIREVSRSAQNRRTAFERRVPSDNVGNASSATEALEVRNDQPGSPVAVTDIDENQDPQGGNTPSPQRSPAGDQRLRVRPAKSLSPELEFDETPGLVPAPQPFVSSTERTENRRQIQRAIATLSSSPSQLAEIQAAVDSEKSPVLAQTRHPVQPTEDYVGFAPYTEKKKGQHHASSKSKAAQSHAGVTFTANRASRQATGQRKLGGLWKGWAGLFKEDFE